MNSPWRVFIALELPLSLKQLLSRQIEAYKSTASAHFRRWTAWQDYHITLQFLGDVEVERIPVIKDRMNEAASTCSPFELSIGGWEIFGRTELPRVLWRTVEGNRERLNETVQTIATSLSQAGYEREERPYSPHVTIARQFMGEERFVLPPSQEDKSLTAWTADQIVLYRTHMHQRPMYEVIHTARLGDITIRSGEK